MASGMVWVRPARFRANVIVAPNSPSARAHVSTAPAIYHAAGTPITTEIAVAASDPSIDNRSAADAPTPDKAPPSRFQGARTKRATTGRRTDAAPNDASATIPTGSRARTVSPGRTEPEVLQRRLTGRLDDVIEERRRRVRVG